MHLNHAWAGASASDLLHATGQLRGPAVNRTGPPIETRGDHVEEAHAGAGGGAPRPVGARRDTRRAGQLPGLPRQRPLDVDGPAGRREASAPRRPGLVREVGPRRHAPLHRLPHRQGRLPARVEAVQDPARRDGGLLRAVQEVPLLELHQDARRRALPGGREGQPAGRALRRLPRFPRHRPSRRTADARLRDLLELPQEGLRGLQRQRAREGRHPGEQRRAGVHRLPPRPRRGRPAGRRPLAPHRRDSAAAATPTRS